MLNRFKDLKNKNQLNEWHRLHDSANELRVLEKILTMTLENMDKSSRIDEHEFEQEFGYQLRILEADAL